MRQERVTATGDGVDVIVGQWAAERPELETLPMEVFGRIYRIARLMGDRVERAYAPFGIGRGEFDVLATLRRSGEPYTLSPSQLSAALMLTTGGMTGRLDKLARAELVQRIPDPTDRRALRARLTAKGRRVVDEALTAGLAEQTAALNQLPAAQREQLAGLLRTLLAAC
ncbi:MarR family transcriptional regulator [Micromonospora sp. NPDC049301]|uniref:MarR family winged helix-turn-helix transcriptional regulator n=1 Tax=Micromonospora sp. NPDC049301 TaxID=3155723 RepID=UPI0034164C50